MSSDAPAIVVERVSKAFPVFKRPADRLLQMLSMGRGRFYEVFTALNGVSVTLNRGETVGIVGPNGSGKSTLLQVIAGLLQPNAGRLQVDGRTAALLELGAGFNPEFTGRENIHLNAAILGLDEREIEDRFDRIVEFSGLAFSVAISVDPDILIVDEALAVGDEGFQRKCLARIEAMRDAGTTILFVSHAMTLITQLCDRAILMDRGEILIDGEPKHVAANYYRLTYAPGSERERIRTEIAAAEAHALEAPVGAAGEPATPVAEIESALDETFINESQVEYESKGARIEDPRIETVNGQRVNVLARGKSYVVRYEVRFHDACEKVRFATLFKTKTGIEMAGRASHPMNDDLPDFAPGDRVSVAFNFTCPFLPGTYFANAGVNGLVDGERQSVHRIIDAIMFQVVPDGDDTLSGLLDINIIASVDRHRAGAAD